jgi:hypothetical protein
MCLRRWILLFGIVGSLCQMSFAQTSDWAIVKQLLPGQKVKVETVDGKSHVGKVQSITDDAIELGKQLFQKQDVRQVQLWSPGHHGRNALIGLGIGAGVGLGFGASCNERNSFTSKGACMAVGAPFFGGIGAGIGALLPSNGSWHQAYRSQ